MNKNRQQDNFQILDILFEYLKKNPDIRFGQALHNLNVATHRREDKLTPPEEKWPLANYEDIFYEEPDVTLIKMRTL